MCSHHTQIIVTSMLTITLQYTQLGRCNMIQYNMTWCFVHDISVCVYYAVGSLAKLYVVINTNNQSIIGGTVIL